MNRTFAAVLLISIAPTFVYGQAGTAPPPPAAAVQLPLSGRTAETGSVAATQSPIPGTTTSVNTINPSISVAGPFAGSVAPANRPFAGKLSLREAVERGLAYNLGATGLSTIIRQAEGQKRVVRSALMPNLTGNMNETVEQVDLAASGFHFNFNLPGIPIRIPSVVGPFNFFDLRAHLTQTVADFTALNNYRASVQSLYADQYFAKDARDLIVLAVGGAYLQVIAAQARVVSEQAQIETATALFDQTSQQRSVGLVAQIDVNQSEVQKLTQQQRLISLRNDLAKQKINLARLVGLPSNAGYELTDDIPFAPAPALTEDDAVKQAIANRSDIKASEAQVAAAERSLAGARAERLPTLGLAADYGVIGENPSNSHGTFSVTGSLRVPIWLGGRTEGDIAQASAALDQRRAELNDLKGRVEADVRNAFLDLTAAAGQVELAQRNLTVAKDTLDLTKQRFDAGVADSVAVSQAQTAVASAQLDLINSVFAHNLAKLTLARSEGGAEASLAQYLKLP